MKKTIKKIGLACLAIILVLCVGVGFTLRHEIATLMSIELRDEAFFVQF